jgi:UDP-N-acetyl-D-glucosamine/UDP-N-acetyl-D-galactosamine dehydrogenase
MLNKEISIAVIGLGYVGLPLAVSFGKKYKTVGFDINSIRVSELISGYDRTLEINSDELNQSRYLTFTDQLMDLSKCNFYICTVPTPVNSHNIPDLSLVYEATKMIGEVLKKGDFVVFESTVYPGVTEEECVPILENVSQLEYNSDFFCGYSPERINPGDKTHTFENIIKITSGSTREAGIIIDTIYQSVVKAGTYMAPSIKVAEAAKVIENTQRDINIAFVNELSMIFNVMGIDTREVLEAASTKWNFLNFKPGLVGGHCIGVDPYYLAYKAQSFGYHPEMILAGRRINDVMPNYVALEFLKGIIQSGIQVRDSSILVLGITFKENCPDIRNSKVLNLINILQSYGTVVEVCDPWVDEHYVLEKFGLKVVKNIFEINWESYSALLLAVSHIEFNNINWINVTKKIPFIYDLKSIIPKEFINKRL